MSSNKTPTTQSDPIGAVAAAANKRAKPRKRATPKRTRPTAPPQSADDDSAVRRSAPAVAADASLGLLPSANTLASAEQLISGLANLAPNRVTRSVKQMAERVFDWAGTAAEVAVGATAPLIKEPTRRAAMEKAGAVLRDARMTAGMTANDVAAALDFTDTNVLDLAESGRIALPFEVILRLAALLARNDPIPFVMNLTRVYNPGLWKIIEQLGIGRVALQVGREREFINIYRSRDSARALSDDEFKLVAQFTDAAFAMALDLVRRRNADTTSAKRGAPKGDKAAKGA